MNTRIKLLRTKLLKERDGRKYTQKDFSDRLGLSENFVWQIEKGDRIPSDRTIADICREFNVNESWIRIGKGDPFCPISRNIEIETFMNSVMHGENDDFRRRLVAVLAKLDTSEWKLLEKMAQKLAAESDTKPQFQVIRKAGRDGSFTETVTTDEERTQLNTEYEQHRDASADI